MVDPISHMFVTGPNVVKKVLYQEIDKEALGGSEMHASISGVSHFKAKDERECFAQVRSLLRYLPQSWDEKRIFEISAKSIKKKYRVFLPIQELLMM